MVLVVEELQIVTRGRISLLLNENVQVPAQSESERELACFYSLGVFREKCRITRLGSEMAAETPGIDSGMARITLLRLRLAGGGDGGGGSASRSCLVTMLLDGGGTGSKENNVGVGAVVLAAVSVVVVVAVPANPNM